MIKKRIIPKILVDASSEGSQVLAFSSIQYKSFKRIGSPLSQLRILESNMVDELSIINLGRRLIPLEFSNFIENTLRHLNSPVTAGGNLNNFEQMGSLIRAGADKVISSFSTSKTDLFKEFIKFFGSQSLVISLDYEISPDNYFVLRNETIQRTESNFLEIVTNLNFLKIGELVLNDITRDGMGIGVDISTLDKVRKVSDFPIVSSSGVGKAEDFIDAFHNGADGVSAGSFFATMDQNPLQVRSRIFNSGIPVRPH